MSSSMKRGSALYSTMTLSVPNRTSSELHARRSGAKDKNVLCACPTQMQRPSRHGVIPGFEGEDNGKAELDFIARLYIIGDTLDDIHLRDAAKRSLFHLETPPDAPIHRDYQFDLAGDNCWMASQWDDSRGVCPLPLNNPPPRSLI
ncbi:hypothetical protein Q7P35_010679 [Cladosporium inversicolor]